MDGCMDGWMNECRTPIDVRYLFDSMSIYFHYMVNIFWIDLRWNFDNKSAKWTKWARRAPPRRQESVLGENWP